MATTTKNMQVVAGNASANVTAQVTDSIPGVPCPGPAGYTYKGLRYVPVFADPIEWSSENSYEALTVVMHEGNSYTSKQAVPVGIDILNETFWAKTYDFNAQVESLRASVEYVLGTTPREYATVADMVEDTKLLVGDYAIVQGYYAALDGGCAVYLISDTATDVKTANGYAVFTDFQGFCRPEQFGARGDGVADDSQAIAKAIATKLEVRLLDKTYAVKQNISLSNSCEIMGSGWSSVLSWQGPDSPMFTIGEGATNVHLKNFYALTPFNVAQMNTNGTFVELNYGAGSNQNWNAHLEDLKISGFNLALDFLGSDYSSECLVEHCKINNNRQVAHFNNIQAVNNTFINSALETNSGDNEPNTPLIVFEGGSANFYGCSIIGKQFVLFAPPATEPAYQRPSFVNIANCRFEHHITTLSCFKIDSKSTLNHINMLNVISCQLYNHNNPDKTYLVETNNRCNVTIDSLSLQGASNLAFAKVTPKTGMTGTASIPYAIIKGFNCNDFEAPSDIPSGNYTGYVFLEGRNGIAHTQPCTNDARTQSLYITGTTGQQLSKSLITLPYGCVPVAIENYVNFATSSSPRTSVLYVVKNKDKWTNPEASLPSEEDMTKIAEVVSAKAGCAKGYVQIDAKYGDTNSIRAGENADYTDCLYLIDGGKLTGDVAVEYRI